MANNEKETLREAAEAATALLPKFQKQRAKADNQIARLQAVIDAWAAVSGKRQKATSPGAAQPGVEERKRHPRGQADLHIDAALAEGRSMDESSLRDRIKELFGVLYPRTTIQATLRRGEGKKKYQSVDGKWKKA